MCTSLTSFALDSADIKTWYVYLVLREEKIVAKKGRQTQKPEHLVQFCVYGEKINKTNFPASIGNCLEELCRFQTIAR